MKASFFPRPHLLLSSSSLSLIPSSIAKSSHKHLNQQQLWGAMKACTDSSSISIARKIHACLVVAGFEPSLFLQNNLISLYFNVGSSGDACRIFRRIPTPNVFSWNIMINGFSKFGRLDLARKMFAEMPQRDTATWNSLMSGHFGSGNYKEILELFILMLRDGIFPPNLFTFAGAMKACGALEWREFALQLHDLVTKYDFGREEEIQVSLLDMYVRCEALDMADMVFQRLVDPNLFCWNSMILVYTKLRGVEHALELFCGMTKRDAISWNTMISVLSQHGRCREALQMAIQMRTDGCMLDSTTFSCVLKACSSIPDVDWGRHVHAQIIRTQPSIGAFVGSSLIDMYAKCGHLEAAKRAFDYLPDCVAAAWTALIGGYAQSGNVEEAFRLFNQMRTTSVPLDQFSLANALAACCSNLDVSLVMQLHSLAIKIGYGSSTAVSNALLSAYAKCGSVKHAESVFHWIPAKDVISWTSMVTAYSHVGNVRKAREYFDSMATRNVVTWNAMLAAYIQHGHFEEGLKMFILMIRQSIVRPDWITFTTLLCACADSAAWRLGNQVVAHVLKVGLNSDISVVNGIITMCSKCGRIDEARDVFDAILHKDLVSWNAMISAYAQHGLGKEAVEIFEKMLHNGTEPDFISYVAVLSGCSYSGLVAVGKNYFNSMTRIHKISPGIEHFSCMVDLLGRAGLLQEAKEMIDNMHIPPSTEVWGALLGACKIHGNTELAEISVKHLLRFDLKDSGSYVMMAKLYSDSGNLDDTAEMRRIMKHRGIRKNPGCSWIEIKNRIHVFTADDAKHPQIEAIERVLNELMTKIKGEGYDERESLASQSLHSEKLAVTFGLMSLPEWMAIHVMKNLRICTDCHLVIKLISKVTARELVVRDANRFHHFRSGCCSCGDYW